MRLTLTDPSAAKLHVELKQGIGKLDPTARLSVEVAKAIIARVVHGTERAGAFIIDAGPTVTLWVRFRHNFDTLRLVVDGVLTADIDADASPPHVVYLHDPKPEACHAAMTAAFAATGLTAADAEERAYRLLTRTVLCLAHASTPLDVAISAPGGVVDGQRTDVVVEIWTDHAPSGTDRTTNIEYAIRVEYGAAAATQSSDQADADANTGDPAGPGAAILNMLAGLLERHDDTPTDTDGAGTVAASLRRIRRFSGTREAVLRESPGVSSRWTRYITEVVGAPCDLASFELAVGADGLEFCFADYPPGGDGTPVYHWATDWRVEDHLAFLVELPAILEAAANIMAADSHAVTTAVDTILMLLDSVDPSASDPASDPASAQSPAEPGPTHEDTNES